MPKKKIQHKGKPKQATGECEGAVTPTENTEEEYATVVDYVNNKKYSKRLIESNWSKYETKLSNFESWDEFKEEEPRIDDFNYLLKTASSDCSHFQFNSEKLWESESNSVPASKIFNLDLNVLSNGLACVPFYERMGIDEKELTVEDKERFDKEAENNWKQYSPVREKLAKESEDDSSNKSLKSDEQTLGESLEVKLDLNSEDSEKPKSIDGVGKGQTEMSIKEIDISDKNERRGNKIEKKKQSIFSSESDENLEDWLDSVLDD